MKNGYHLILPGHSLRSLVTLFIVCLSLPVLSQSFQIKTFTTKDGLPSPYILNTYQDKTGYLWIGSPNGLSRFDGRYFTNYGFSNGFFNTRIGPVLMDDDSKLWVATSNAIGEIRGNRFINYPLSDSVKNFDVHSMLLTSDRSIWSATSSGVYRFTGNNWQKVRLYTGYEDHNCYKIIETEEGMYINYGDIIVLKKKDGSFREITSLQKEGYHYFSMQQCSTTLYVCSIDGVYTMNEKGLTRMTGLLGTLKTIYTFFRDSRNRSWVGSEADGLRMLPADDSPGFVQIYKKPLINLISGIMEDDKGNIWVSDFEGLVKVTEPGYTVYGSAETGALPPIRNMIHAPGRPPMINDGSLNLYSFNNGRFSRKRLTLGKNSVLPNNELIIDYYCTDEKNDLWLSLRGFELAKLENDVIKVQFKNYMHLGRESFDVIYDSVRKKITTAVLSQPLPCQYTGTGFAVMKVKDPVNVPGIIRKLHQCANGSILFSTEDGNLFSIDRQDHCKEQLTNNKVFPGVSLFLNDPSGDVWICLGGIGLRRCGWRNDSLVIKETLDQSNGLMNNYIIGACFDDQQNLWVGTFSGISVLADKDRNGYKTIYTLSLSDLDMEISEASKMTMDNYGNAWLTFPDKLVCFHPGEMLKHRQLTPGIQIEDVKLNLQQTDWSRYTDSVSGIFGIPKHLSLSYDKNSIGIYYKGISSSGTENIQYSYQLTSLSDEWSPPSATDFVSFVKLVPGKYVFKVKARLTGTGWSEPAVFEFEIRKPFWETWWFRAMVLFLASGMIIFIFSYRIRQVKARTEVKHQLLDLEMKALKAQMNPHFIYNSLNSIQSLIANDKPTDASRYISQFAKLLRQVLEQSDTNTISLQKELQTLELYISLESLRLSFEPQYHLSIADNIQPANEKIPPLILQPFVENSLWHGLSSKEGDKRINIRITADEEWLTCVIEDNGIGRQKAEALKSAQQAPDSKGMDITWRRLFDFNKDNHTTPIIFEDLQDPQGNPSGTKVTLHIKRVT